MTTLDDLQRAPARAARSPLSTSVAIWGVSLLALWRCCPYLGRVPLVLLAAGSVTCAIWYVLRRLPAHRAQVFAALAVIAFYTCSALTSVKPEELTSVKAASDHTSFYQALSESLLQLELTLPVEPDRRLLAAANPYNPARDYPFVWDAAYYHGRYYVYHGIAPVLTLFLPFRIITQRSLPIQFGLLVFLSAGFVGSLCVLERARAACGLRRPNAAIQVLSVLLLGFASISPIVLRRPSVYEVAIGSAYCFLMWGCNFLIIQSRRRDAASALLASLCLGLCTASRPTYGVVGGLLLLVFAMQARVHWKSERWAVISRTVPLLVPFGALVFLMALYNKARFDSWTQFGVRYQLNHLDMYNVKMNGVNMLRGVVYYLFSLPRFSTHFPGVNAGLPTRPFQSEPHAGIHEEVLGVFGTIPVICFLALAPLAVWCRRSFRLLGYTTTLLVFAGLMLLAASNFGVSARYQLDFVPALLLASILAFYAGRERGGFWWRAFCELLWIPAACFSIMVGTLASISDFQDGGSLKKYHPSLYQMLRTLAWPEGKQFDAQ